MFLFAKDYFFESLKNLTVTEEQIRTVGLYIKTFKKEYKNIIEVIDYVYNVSSIHHKLILLYLINEILQTDKNYDEESVQLKTSLKEFIQKVFPKTKAESKKILQLYKKFCDLDRVWNERNVINIGDKFNMEEFFIEVDHCSGNEKLIIEVLSKYLDKLKKSQT